MTPPERLFQPTPTGVDPEAWRQRTLDVWSSAMAVTVVVAMGYGVATGQFYASWSVGRGFWLATLLFLVAAIRLPRFRLPRILLLVASSMLVVVVSLLEVGLVPSTILFFFFAVFTAAVMFPVRGTVVAWAVLSVVLLTLLVLIGSGVLPVTFDPARLDPRILRVSIRLGIVTSLLCGCMAIGATLIVNRLLDSLKETHEASVALEASQAQWRSLVDNAPLVISIVDRDYRVVFANRGFLGYSREEALGERFGLAAPDQASAETLRALVDQVFETGEPEWYETVAVGRDGTRATFGILLSPITKQGRVDLVTVIARDVTERLRLEDQLRESQKLQAVGELTGGIAHDFNNLLTVVQANMELLLEEDDPQEVREVAADALEAVERGSQLTHRLLAFSRRQSLAPRAVDLPAFIRGFESLLSRTLGDGVVVQSVVPTDLWECTADHTQLEHALLNLCINGRDAMPLGGRLLIDVRNRSVAPEEAETVDELAPGDYVAVTVTDSGMGIEPDLLAHVVEPFYTTKEVGKGTGLGLSMVYGFAKQSGGHFRIESEMGVGTSVRLLIPRHTDETAEAE